MARRWRPPASCRTAGRSPPWSTCTATRSSRSTTATPTLGGRRASRRRAAAFFSNTYNYPNQQEATTLWFHDHTLGIVRLNLYAGLIGFYFIRDNRDTGLANNPITLPAGP